MKTPSLILDAELLSLMPTLVRAERARMADVIEHLVEIDRRRLFLDEACTSLWSYCVERLGYTDDEASKRVRVTRLVSRFPRVLDELRASAIHLTGLFKLAPYLTNENYDSLLPAARGMSKSQLELLIAERFPKPPAPERICPLPEQTAALVLTHPGEATCPGTSNPAPKAGRLEPLSPAQWAVQFTASASLREKLERAREL